MTRVEGGENCGSNLFANGHKVEKFKRIIVVHSRVLDFSLKIGYNEVSRKISAGKRK